MRTPKWYTEKQNEILKSELQLGKRTSHVARIYSIKWNRDFDSLQVKVGLMRRKLGIPNPPNAKLQKQAMINTPVKIKEVIVTPVQEAKLTLPEGMTFEGVAKQVELHSNHFRVYF